MHLESRATPKIDLRRGANLATRFLADRRRPSPPSLTSYKSPRAFVNIGVDTTPDNVCTVQSSSLPSAYTSLPNMDSTYPNHGFDDTYSRTPRSRAGSGVSTTEGLLQNLHLAETPSFETGSYTSSRPPSSAGLASPAYLGPSLSHSSGYLSTPISQHTQPFPSLPSERVVSGSGWFEEDSRARGAPLLRLEPASDHLGAPSSSPLRPSIETETMRYTLPNSPLAGLHIGSCHPTVTDPRIAPSPSRTIRDSVWVLDRLTHGQVRCRPASSRHSVRLGCLLGNSDGHWEWTHAARHGLVLWVGCQPYPA